MLKGLESFLLVEGLSDKGKSFLDLMKWILAKSPQELLSLSLHAAEGVFNLDYIVEDSEPKPKVTAPKGELAEIARGSDHRVVAMRFTTPTGDDKLFYFVIPLLAFSGEELTDNKARSGIQNRFKELYTGLNDGQDMNNVLSTIYMSPSAAIDKLKEIDRFVAKGSPEEREQLSQQAPDPLRDGAVAAIRQYVPTDTKSLETVMKLRPGELQGLMAGHGWDQDARSEFISQAAEMADGDIANPQVIKSIAGLALARLTCGALERKAA